MQQVRLLHAVSQRREYSRQLRVLQLCAAVRQCCRRAFRYQVFLTEAQRAGACIDCGTCEELCPQKIAISDWMPKVEALLADCVGMTSELPGQCFVPAASGAQEQDRSLQARWLQEQGECGFELWFIYV